MIIARNLSNGVTTKNYDGLCIQEKKNKSLLRFRIDQWLRVPSVQDVFALGDFAGFMEQSGRKVLPALAQWLQEKAITLSSYLTRLGGTMVERLTLPNAFLGVTLLFTSMPVAWLLLGVTRPLLIFMSLRSWKGKKCFQLEQGIRILIQVLLHKRCIESRIIILVQQGNNTVNVDG